MDSVNLNQLLVVDENMLMRCGYCGVIMSMVGCGMVGTRRMSMYLRLIM